MQVATRSMACASPVRLLNPLHLNRRKCVRFLSGSQFERSVLKPSPGHRAPQYYILTRQNRSLSTPVALLDRSQFQSSKKADVQVSDSSSNRIIQNPWFSAGTLAILVSGGLTFSTVAALAEEIVVDTSAEGGAVVTDSLLSFLFIAAFIGLSILTIGVIYLSVVDFLEKRERDAMSKAAGSDQEKLGAPVNPKGDRLMPKGFGKKVEKVEKEKKVEQKS